MDRWVRIGNTVQIEWNDDWEEQIKRAAQPALKQFAAHNQPKMDALTEEYKGRPVAEIKPIVDRELKRWGGSIPDDAELTRVATAISEGQRVILRPPA
jgi:hypothetical protein